MNLRNIGSHQNVLELNDGTIVLFSYNTPVAAFIPGRGYVKTHTHYSKTTSKHINAWCGRYAGEVDQTELDNLVNG